LVLLEAMSFHLPVIVSDLPVTREILGNSEAVVFFEKGNEFELAEKMISMANSEKLEEMGLNAFRHTSDYTLFRISEQWENLLENI
jgi:glycosyltransferase involved in cell wall biosynthesis